MKLQLLRTKVMGTEWNQLLQNYKPILRFQSYARSKKMNVFVSDYEKEGFYLGDSKILEYTEFNAPLKKIL